MNMITVDQETLTRMIAQAVEAEREACAKVADDYFGFNAIADAIRARSCPPCNQDCDQGRKCSARGNR